LTIVEFYSIIPLIFEEIQGVNVPTFEQIEKLQSISYVHKKTGHDVISLDTYDMGYEETVIVVKFVKKGDVDNNVITIIIYHDGSTLEGNNDNFS